MKPWTLTLRRLFAAGLLVVLPLAVTWLVLVTLTGFGDRLLLGVLPQAWLPESLPSGLGVVTLLLGLLLVGGLVLTPPGRGLLGFLERLIRRIPLVQNIYFSVKQLLVSLSALSSEKYQRVVLVEYPRRGLHAIGFVTGVGSGEVQALTDARVLSVFLPTTPNPTSGFLLFVPEQDLIPLEMSVEDGIKLVISGGFVTPPWSKETPSAGCLPDSGRGRSG
ncbi:MAG: DUF502 domain-containing protein [Magnetococcales bacterium]|nr:DUF502 domain-containing protein [Magnetococcales bacterium]